VSVTDRLDIYDSAVNDTIIQWSIVNEFSSRIYNFNTEFTKKATSDTIIEDYHRGAYSQPGGILQWIIQRSEIVRVGYKHLIRSCKKRSFE